MAGGEQVASEDIDHYNCIYMMGFLPRTEMGSEN